VRHPSRSGPLLDVYKAVVQHAVLLTCRKTGRKLLRQDSAEYENQKRQTVLRLLSERCPEGIGNGDGSVGSVVEYAIERGASKFLRTIVNTPGVFRFDNRKQGCVVYDVTDMTPFTRLSSPDHVNDGRYIARGENV